MTLQTNRRFKTGFGKWSVVLTCCMLFCGMGQARDIELELQMPGVMFWPGSPFGMDLNVTNTGPALNAGELFVALTIGTGDYWFYPGWKEYPPDIDWETVDVPASASDTWEILPSFSWPSGAGAFEGAMFIAAIMDNGVLVSNLADITFGWKEVPSTPTPTPPPEPTWFVYIAPGSFTMGSPSDEPCRDLDETQHQVTLTRGFYMMQTEVTRRMWADLMAVQPTLPNDPSDTIYSPTMNHPVQSNTWYESVLFANLMSVNYGYTRCYYKDAGYATPVDATNYSTGTVYCNFNANGYRLPTESEWEYACRGGTMTAFSCNETSYTSENCSSCTAGTHPTLEQCCVYCANAPGSTAVVGSKIPNPAGLYDIHGNVFEQCWDRYGTYPAGSVTDPTGATSGSYRVSRGGSWFYDAQICRSAVRLIDLPGNRYYTLGFRLLRVAQ